MSSRGMIESAPSADGVFGALSGIESGFDVLAEAGLWQLSGGQVGELITRLHAIENRAAAAQVAAVVEGVSRGLPAEAVHPSGAAWLRGLVPLTPGAAKTRVVLAEQLARPDLAETQGAFTAGGLGVGPAAVLTRTMVALDAIPDIDPVTWGEAQHLLVAAAHTLDAAQLGKAALRLRHRLTPDTAEQLARDEDALERQRSAYLVQEPSGLWLLRAVLTPTGGATLHAALDPLTSPRPSTEFGADPRTGMQRTADALVALAELSLAARPDGPGTLPVRHGSPTRLILTGDLTTLLNNSGSAGLVGLPLPSIETGEPGGWEISPLTFQVLACDAETVPILLSDSGEPLDVGRTQYPFPPRIRRAIETRDTHCTFPTCTAPPAWCHTHHLTPYSQGGTTSAANGTLLCGRHHRHVHTTSWTGHLTDGHITWQPPPRPGHTSDPTPEPALEPTAPYLHPYEHQLRQLAHRWLARNPHLHNTS